MILLYCKVSISCYAAVVCGSAVVYLGHTISIVTVFLSFLSSPDGSYTEEQSQDPQLKVAAQNEFDDEFDDEEVLTSIGTCKAMYPFEGIKTVEK